MEGSGDVSEIANLQIWSLDFNHAFQENLRINFVLLFHDMPNFCTKLYSLPLRIVEQNKGTKVCKCRCGRVTGEANLFVCMQQSCQ